jgi:hypothetical protein
MNVPQPVTPPALPDLGIRVIYMLLFAVVFWALCWILLATTVVQLIVRLLNGRANTDLTRFGGALRAPDHRISDICHRVGALSIRALAGRKLKRTFAAAIRLSRPVTSRPERVIVSPSPFSH